MWFYADIFSSRLIKKLQLLTQTLFMLQRLLLLKATFGLNFDLLLVFRQYYVNAMPCNGSYSSLQLEDCKALTPMLFFLLFFNFIKSQIYYDIHLQYVITLISIIQLKKNAQCAHVTPNLVQWLISWQFQFNETLGCSIDIHVPRAIEWNFTVINLKPCDEHNYFYNYLIKIFFKS